MRQIQRGTVSGFNQNFHLEDSTKAVQRFNAAADMTTIQGAARPLAAKRPVKVRLAKRPSGETPGTEYLATLQQFRHFEYDHYYLDILAEHLPLVWGK